VLRYYKNTLSVFYGGESMKKNKIFISIIAVIVIAICAVGIIVWGNMKVASGTVTTSFVANEGSPYEDGIYSGFFDGNYSEDVSEVEFKATGSLDEGTLVLEFYEMDGETMSVDSEPTFTKTYTAPCKIDLDEKISVKKSGYKVVEKCTEVSKTNIDIEFIPYTTHFKK